MVKARVSSNKLGFFLTYLFIFKLPLNNQSVRVYSGFLSTFKIKNIYSLSKKKLCSVKFRLRALFLFVVGYSIKKAILYFFCVNVISDVFNPISLGYAFFMVIFTTTLTSKLEIFSFKFWKRVFSIFVLGFILRLCIQICILYV